MSCQLLQNQVNLNHVHAHSVRNDPAENAILDLACPNGHGLGIVMVIPIWTANIQSQSGPKCPVQPVENRYGEVHLLSSQVSILYGIGNHLLVHFFVHGFVINCQDAVPVVRELHCIDTVRRERAVDGCCSVDESHFTCTNGDPDNPVGIVKFEA